MFTIETLDKRKNIFIENICADVTYCKCTWEIIHTVTFLYEATIK